MTTFTITARSAALLVMSSGTRRADTANLAQVLGKGTITPATAQFSREHPAQTIGGTAPVGHLGPIETTIDTSLARCDVGWAAAGHRSTVLLTTYEQLRHPTYDIAANVASLEID